MTVAQLVNRFAEIGMAQDRVLFLDNHAQFNNLYGQMDEVDAELHARGREARLGLLPLYHHPNIQVRLRAAARTLPVAPQSARQVLEAIVRSKIHPQAMDAASLIRGLDDGSFKPA